MDLKIKKKQFTLNNFLILFYLIIIILTQSCASYYSFGKDAKNKFFLRGPGTCVQMILFDDSGNGIAIKGKSINSKFKKFKKFESIETVNHFKIKKNDFEKFNELLNKLSKTKISGTPKNDASRIEIYLNGSKKVDTYNFTEDLVMDLIFLFNDNIIHNIVEFCEPNGVID